MRYLLIIPLMLCSCLSTPQSEAKALKISQRVFIQILTALKSVENPEDKILIRDTAKVIDENLKLWEKKVLEGQPSLGVNKIIDKNLTLLAEILARQR